MNSSRTPTNTQRVSSTGVARGTTSVMTADTAVNNTTSAPTGSSTTASAIVTSPALLSSCPPLASLPPRSSALPPPRRAQRPYRLAEALARHPYAIAARARHVHDPVQEPAPPLGAPTVGLPARRDPRLRQHLLHPRRQLGRAEIPQPPPRRSRRQRRRPRSSRRSARAVAVFHASSSPSPPRGSSVSCPIAPARGRCPFSLGLDASFPTIGQLKLATSQFGIRGGIA